MSPPSLHENPTVLKFAAWLFLALAGGAAKFITSLLKNKEYMSIRRFTVLFVGNVFVSGFGGMMGALVFSTISPDVTQQAVAAGIFGYLGTTGLDAIAQSFKKKIPGE